MTSVSSSRLSSALSELITTGKEVSFDPESVRYVCHTATIPLATTVDEQSLLKRQDDSNLVEVTHSIKYEPGYDAAIDYRCCKVHCMYVRKNNSSEQEILRNNCPCGKVVHTGWTADGEEIDSYLQPLCFLQVIKETRYSFGYTDATACESDVECCHNETPYGARSNRPKLDLKDVMFCQNSQSILDLGYSRPLRDALGFSGWGRADSAEKICCALDHLYWFKKFVSNSTRKMLIKLGESNSVVGFKTRITHVLHTLNGLVVQKLLLFPNEMEGYRSLANLTACLFEALLRDYFKTSEEEPTEENSVYLEIKKLKKKVKQAFPSENIEVRNSVFDLVLSNKKSAHTRFWAGCFRRLKRRTIGRDADFTASPLWVFIMGGFSQTRNMGWLPEWVAKHARKQFRETIGRDKVLIPKEDIVLIYKLIHNRLKEAGIERGFLRQYNVGREFDADFREVIHSLRIPLKPTASNTSTVSNGGKVEDARQLLSDAIENRWIVPIRDFERGTVRDRLKFEQSMRQDKPGHESCLFWIALQIMLNYFSKTRKEYAPFYWELPGSEYWENRLWTMQIVHISEPGKERNLTKTSSLVAWVLTVASKVSQMTLAFAMDHRAGLVLSAQDWMHQRRVSAESYESGWMYDRETRMLKPGVWNGFQDWTESTDFICRLVGSTALQAFFNYVEMPRFFADLVLKITLHDYKVTEILGTTFDKEMGVLEKEIYEGRVSEGFMMSMPLTKTILHLMHDVNVGLVHVLLDKIGVKFSPRVTEARYDPTRDEPGKVSMLRGV